MEVVTRTINMRFFCHKSQHSFNKLINPDDTSGLTCEQCGTDFVEIVTKNNTVPSDPRIVPSQNSPTRHRRCSSKKSPF